MNLAIAMYREYRLDLGPIFSSDLFLPTVNACLNLAALVLLIAGVRLVRAGKITVHRNFMFAAFGTSCLFLFFYVLHKVLRYRATGVANKTFNHTGVIKLAYLLMLFTHLTLAMIVPVLALRLIYLGLRREDAKHRRLARVAYPIWLYVSLTGVLIYLALYHWNPA